MATIKKPICTLGIIGIFSFILFIVPAQSDQNPIDCLLCQSITMTTLVENSDLIIMSSEGKGIVIDNTKSKLFDNNTAQIIGIMKIDKGKYTGSYWGKYMDPNGDLYIIELSQTGPEFDWKFIYGTGKFKGITGGGKSFRYTKGKPISPGTAQVCSKITGTYELKP